MKILFLFSFVLLFQTLTQGQPQYEVAYPSITDDFVTLNGNVQDQKTRSPLNTNVSIYYNSDFIKEYSGNTPLGVFSVQLKNFGWYIISISSAGYRETIDTLWVINNDRKSINRDFYMTPVEVGLSVTLNNVFFDFGRTSLSSQSLSELDKEIIFIRENPGFSFEVAGFTDSDGPADYNQILSQGRAQVVVDYLVNHGADRSKLTARGYGATRPVYTGITKSGKQRNRRVELIVVATGL
jgi:outer membrane protein OmpA-like peptidoglycan-associated protein